MKPITSLLLLVLLVGCSNQPSSTSTLQSNQNMVNMKTNPVLNIAHRGARSIAPENTLAAARKGLEIGADLWELDVAMSKDGELVILHDDTLNRTSDAATVYADRKPWNVTEFTLAELRKLDFGAWYNLADPFKQISGGVVTQEDKQKFVGIQIPTLREALVLTKDSQWKVNVEIKDHKGKEADATIVEKVVALIGELGMEKSVIISSFNHDYLVRVKKANVAIQTGALTNNAENDPVALVEKLGADAYNPNFKFINADQVAKLRAAGKKVYVWTVNDEPTMRLLIGMGVSGIITDFPQLLKTVLASYTK